MAPARAKLFTEGLGQRLKQSSCSGLQTAVLNTQYAQRPHLSEVLESACRNSLFLDLSRPALGLWEETPRAKPSGCRASQTG